MIPLATPFVPDDFIKELARNKKANAFFETLNKTNLYSIAYRLHTAKNARNQTEADAGNHREVGSGREVSIEGNAFCHHQPFKTVRRPETLYVVMAWLLPVSAFSSWSRLELATAWHRTLRLRMSGNAIRFRRGGLHSSWRACRCSSRQGDKVTVERRNSLGSPPYSSGLPSVRSPTHLKDAPSTHMRCHNYS